jgi:fermentation-respiration switch protein FrsA (DUF1100 family)
MNRPAVIAGLGVAAAALAVPITRSVGRRGARRLLDAPRFGPDEAELDQDLDRLGGEVVRLRSRHGVALTGRWLPAETGEDRAGHHQARSDWRPDAHEAIVLLHGYTGSVVPDVVEYGPFLRRTASVFALDFRGHGGSDDGPTTFGLLEVEDIAGALAWLGQREVDRVALMGTSMGGIAAIAAVAVLGDGSLPGADVEIDLARQVAPPLRPRIIAVVGDSVAPELEIPVASRLPGPAPRFLAARLFDGATRILGADPRATEPIRVIGLVEPVPVMLIHGEADRTVPIADGRRLVAAGGSSVAGWVVPGADHSSAHRTAPEDYERRTTDFLRMAFERGRTHAAVRPAGQPIIAGPVLEPGTPTPATPRED